MDNRLLRNGFIAGIMALLIVIGFQLKQRSTSTEPVDKSLAQREILSKIEQAIYTDNDQKLIDSLILLAEPLLLPKLHKEDPIQQNILFLKSLRFSRLQHISQAQKCLEQAESLISKADSQREFDIIKELQSIYGKTNNSKRSNELLSKYINQNYHPHLRRNKAELLLSKANHAFNDHSRNQALRLISEAQEIAKENNDSSMVLKCRTMHYHMDTSINSESRLLGLLEIEQHYKYLDPDNLWRLFSSIGDLYYYDLLDYERAYEYMIKQFEATQLLDNNFHKMRISSMTLLNLSDAAYTINRLKEAKYWIDSAETYIAYMNTTWLPNFHDAYVKAYELDEQDALAKLAEINDFVQQEHIASTNSHTRLIEGQNQIALKFVEKRSNAKLFWISLQRWALSILTLLLLYICYAGYQVSKKSRRQIELANGVKGLQNLFIYGSLQARPPIHCHLKNVMLDAKIKGFDDLADKVTTATKSLKYTAEQWEDPLISLNTELSASRLLIDMWANDDYYNRHQIELVVENSMPAEALLVPRYFIKSCLFLIMHANIKGNVHNAQMILTYTHEQLRATATLDNKVEMMIEFDRCTEAINKVLNHYNMPEITFEPAGDRYVINIPIPYKVKKGAKI